LWQICIHYAVHFTIGPGTFQGTIPSEIGKCTNLQELSLINSNITGELPIEIAELRNLKLLDVSLNNDLSGTILEESNYQTTLEFMDLTGTKIDCPPNNFCTNLNLQISIAKDCDCTCCDHLR
jgi:Leucine-rich repeat (LRR) protein